MQEYGKKTAQLLFVSCVLVFAGIFSAESVFSAPTISSVSSAVTHGSLVSISGSAFGTRADYNDINDTWNGYRYMNFRWTDFSFPTFLTESNYNSNRTQTDGFYPQRGGAYWSDWNIYGLSIENGGPSNSYKFLKRRMVSGAPESGGSSVWMPSVADNYDTLYIANKFAMITSGGTPPQQSGKAWRIWGDGNAGSIYMTSGGGSYELRGDGSTEDCPTEFNGDGVQWGGGSSFTLGQWDRVDFLLDKPSGYVRGYVNGDEQWASKWWCSFGLGDHTIDIPDMIDQAFRGNGENGSYNFTDIYIDFTRARVELCDTSTISTSNKCEIQIPISWSNSSVQIAVNKGEFTNGQTAYLYVVDSTGAVNSAGYPVTIGSGSTSDTTPPTSPTNLAATSTSQSSITVSWNPATDDIGVVRYDIERCTGLSCSNFSQVGTVQNSPYIDSNLTASTGYSYHVRAVDAAGNMSGWSNVVGATTQTATPSDETIIDNTDTASVSSSGNWLSSTAYPGYYGSDYFYSSTTTGEWFQWTTSSLTPGTYEVYARWPAVTGRPTDVNYQITHASSTATVGPVNQEINGSQWNLLGTYSFNTTGTVRVIGTATGWEGTAADAVRFLNVTPTPQPCSLLTTPTTWNNNPNHISFAPPYDLFNNNASIVQADCTPGSPTTMNLSIGNTTDTSLFSLMTGYYWNGSNWTSYTTTTCSGNQSGSWCQGETTGTITDTSINTADQSNPQYFLGFTCKYTGSLPWKCGCQDTSCTTPSWQLQGAGL